MATLFSYFKKVNSTPGGSENESNDKRDRDEDSPEGGTPVSVKKRKVTTVTPISVSKIKRRSSSAYEKGEQSSPCTPRNYTHSSPCPSPVSNHLDSSGTFTHEELVWLQKDQLKDKSGCGCSHPDYNPRTLLVPRDYFNKLTPAFQQWWTIKSENFDCVIMFKVGKFYEMYHEDAVIGVRECSLTFMKAEFAHCGFPEAAFGRYSNVLVQRGYKVVRVEQVETPAMMEDRIKRRGVSSKSDRAVRREVCSIITKGTRTLTSFDGCVQTSGEAVSYYLLAVRERQESSKKSYGVCFVDTCVGTFHLGEFEDDEQSSRLRTMMAHFPPAHLLYERRGVGVVTMNIINQILSNNIKEALVPETEFWSCVETIRKLMEKNYFSQESQSSESGQSSNAWPESFNQFLDGGMAVAPGYELAVSALGAVVWCLSRAHKDFALLSLGQFQVYDPVDCGHLLRGDCRSASYCLVLDDVTLSNLDVLSTSDISGTLLRCLDHTVTPFGRRLLRRWLCGPLVQVVDIEARQDAVQELMEHTEVVQQTTALLASCPDLERLLRKIHTIGCQSLDQTNPDSRAIFFEHVLYSKRKFSDFISLLEGLRVSLKIQKLFATLSLRSDLLRQLLTLRVNLGINLASVPSIEEHLSFYETSFDPAQARERGEIIPRAGVNSEYDLSVRDITDIEDRLQSYLNQQKRKLKCSSLTYWGSGRNRYQLEVPEAVLNNISLGGKYELKSQKKGFRRYRTPKIEELLEKLISAEERRDAALRNTLESLFHSFDEHFQIWEDAVRCLSQLDVLISLSMYSSCGSEIMCRPQLVECGTEEEPHPFLLIEDGRHPCIVNSSSGTEFIPNSVCIHHPSNCLLVTGPNMGGKSTLLRQCGLLVVLAQMGSFVPASKMSLSPVDRVFTRMGASDNIMARESTFFVELKETAAILQHATQHSLVLVDELGRGTATYDGAAIASAVVKRLAEEVTCRTLFSTHYHFIMDQFTSSSCVQLGHMACLVESSNDEETITFLYQLTEGVCPKSYGFNVASLAGVPKSVVSVARARASMYEKTCRHIRSLRKLLTGEQDVTALLHS